MSKKELIKQGIAEAEKEAQEKEVAFIKRVTKKYLEDIQSYKTKEEEIKTKRKILEAELTDLKNGRLDKIKERQDTDNRCKDISPITIIIINNNYPLKPWLNEYSIQWNLSSNPMYTVGEPLLGTNSPLTKYNSRSSDTTITGTTCQVMATGAYKISGKIINL